MRMLVKIGIPAAVLVVEAWLLNKCSCEIIPVLFMVMVAIAIPILLILISGLLKKGKQRKSIWQRLFASFRILLSILSGNAKSFPGAVLLLFTLIHIAWIGDSIGDAFDSKHIGFQPDLQQQWLIALTQMGFLIMPFAWLNLIVERKKPATREDRQILISMLSYLAPQRPPEDATHFPTRKDLILAYLKDPRKFIDHPNPWQTWNPIRECLKTYPNLKQLTILLTPQVQAQTRELDLGSPFEVISKLTSSCWKEELGRASESPGIIIKEVPEATIQHVEDCYYFLEEHLKRNVSVPDEAILFHITSGTAAFSAAAALHGIKGKRGICYVTQGPGKKWDREKGETEVKKGEILELDIDLFTLEDLVGEFREKFEES